MISGMATPDGTDRYRQRFAGSLDPAHFRRAAGLRLSSIGIGTYLGHPDAETDALYQEAIETAVRGGVNVIDTAINYRYQLSERAVGRALAVLLQEGFARDELLICTKGGFLPGDATAGLDERRYYQERIVRAGVGSWDDVVAGCHVLAPAYLRHQLTASRANLHLETIDVYYLHNPETQLMAVTCEEFLRRLRAAFEALEAAAAAGEIHWYGTATWEGYRVPAGSGGALSLADIVQVARDVAGEEHHFRFAQLPFNLGMPEAFTSATQTLEGRTVPFLLAAEELGVVVIASGSLLQSRLLGRLPAELQARFPGLDTDAQRALQFVRSTPGIATALVGMKQAAHVRENLRVASVSPMPAAEHQALFGP